MGINAIPLRNPAGWLRGPAFDLTLIAGVLALAVGAGTIVVLQPHWFYVVLALDLWLLGYPHVVATFTRISFDTESFLQNRFLVLGLPWLVLAGSVAVGVTWGTWAIATTYLYWQWFHYTRQSYGLMRYYVRSRGPSAAAVEGGSVWMLYLVPLWGILYRSYQGQETFLGLEVKYVPVPESVVHLVGALALGSIAYWAWGQYLAWRRDRLPLALTLYLCSHCAAFVMGYLVIEDISAGWLVINVWHNAQYLLIVWMYNANRFKEGVDQKHRFLSTLSQSDTRSVIRYFFVTVGLSFVVYTGILVVLKSDWFAAIPLAAIIIYQTINFHHYIVDGLIWTRKRRKVRIQVGAARS